MRSSVLITIDLTATTNNNSVSQPVPVPPWARAAAMYPLVRSWSGAVAELLEAVGSGVGGGEDFFSFATAASLSTGTPVRGIDVRFADRVRLKTTAANASADVDARFVVVFTDLQE